MVGPVPQVRREPDREEPADSFIDPQGYRAFLDDAEAEFRSGRTH
jgi:hypothetical protein